MILHTPRQNEKRLTDRFDYVVKGMVEAEWLTPEEAANIKFPVIAPRVTSGSLSGPKGHIIEAVSKELKKLGFTEEQLMVGGLSY